MSIEAALNHCVTYHYFDFRGKERFDKSAWEVYRGKAGDKQTHSLLIHLHRYRHEKECPQLINHTHNVFPDIEKERPRK